MSNLEDSISVDKQITISGKVYNIQKLKLQDYAALYERAKRNKKKELIDTYQLLGKEPNLDKVMNVSLTQEESVEASNSFTGIIFLLWRVLRKDNPDLTEEEVGNLIDINEMNDLLESITDEPTEEDKADKKKVIKKVVKKKK